MRLGLDIGSTTIKCVVLDDNNKLLYSTYERHYSQITTKIGEILTRVRKEIDGVENALVAMSGSAGMGVAEQCDITFVQDNQSMSTKGVLRGLHFQKNFPQTKLVRVIKGSVFDVAVDLRSESETYGKWYGIELTEENKKQFLIPRGFAHGFLVLSDTAEFCYKIAKL